MTDKLKNAIKSHQSGDLITAEKVYREILLDQPDQTDVEHLLGIVLAQQFKFEEALIWLERAAKHEPHQPALQNSLANVYKNLNKLELAQKHYQNALTLKPDYAAAQHNLANIFYQQGNYKEAAKNYRQAIAIQANYADAHYHLGNTLTQLEEKNEAIAEYYKALELDPNHAASLRHLGQLLLQQNQFSSAIEQLTKSLALEPDADAEHNLATALLKINNIKDAKIHFEKALTINPKHVPALENLATTYLTEHHLEPALKYYLQAVMLEPSAETFYNIGVIFMHQDRHQDAINNFLQALTHQPDYLDAHLNLAATYLKQEKYAAAELHYQAALKLKPDDQEIIYLLKALSQKNTPDAAPTEYLQHLFDQYAPYYDEHLTKHLLYQVPELMHKALLERSHPEDWRILDLGCGTGLAGAKFRPYAKELIGIDISAQMIAIATEKNIYDKLKVADVKEALLEFHHLDLILAADVFTYIGNLSHIIKTVTHALNQKGKIAFTIEKTDSYPFILQKTARYAHNVGYIESLAEQNLLSIVHQQQITLRQQFNQPVLGYLFILQKN